MPAAAHGDSCMGSIYLLGTYMLCLEISLGGCLKGGGEEPMRHAHKLLHLISPKAKRSWKQPAYCRHRFEATKRSSERAFGRHRCMCGSHPYIPGEISNELRRIRGESHGCEDTV